MTSNFAYRYVSLTPEHETVSGARGQYGTASLMTASGKIYGEVDDESIAYQFDVLSRSDMSRYGQAKSVNGKEYSEGGLNLVMQPDDTLGLLLYGIYGDNATVDSVGYTCTTFTHSWKEANDLVLPSFTLEIGREEKMHTYTGMCINSLSISAAHGEYATITADFTGRSESALAPLTASTAVIFGGAALDGFHFANGSVYFSEDGTSSTESLNVKSISLDYSMNLDTDAACSIGNRTYIRQPQPQLREITGTVEFSTAQSSVPPVGTPPVSDTPDYETALSTGGKIFEGNNAGTTPAIRLEFTNATQSLTIGIQKVRWNAPTQNVSGRDTSTLSMSFTALLDVDSNTMSKMTLVHTDASTALLTGVKYSIA